MTSARTIGFGLAAAPVGALVGSLLWLALDHRTPWVLGAVVHEGGRYTLEETILYFRHFLREVPLAVTYAVASAAAAAVYGPSCTAAPSRMLRGAALAASALLVAGAWVGTLRAWGSGVAWRELLQSYLHDEDAPVAGVHWGYHLLATFAYAAAAVVLAALLRRLVDGGRRRPRAAGRLPVGCVVTALVGMTALCGTGTAPLCDPRHLGHQAREACTHLLVTLPLSFAVLLAAGRWGPAPGPIVAGPPPRGEVRVAAGVAAVALGYLALGAIVSGAAQTARPGAALSSLVAAHVFEHSLDYVLVALLVIALAPGDVPARIGYDPA